MTSRAARLLEESCARLRGQEASARRATGRYYTPLELVEDVLSRSLRRTLRERFRLLRASHGSRAPLTPAFWREWQEAVLALRIVDPACGGGAFLVGAHRVLAAALRAAESRGGRAWEPAEVVRGCLFGVDEDAGAIALCARALGSLAGCPDAPANLRVGNSVVSDADLLPAALDWNAAFPAVLASGGFDLVVGNPPYVRQEQLSEWKPYFERRYRVYHGAADLYAFFCECGFELLRPGGRLAFVVAGKWLRASYGERLRGFLAEHSWVEEVLELGADGEHFPGAEVAPCVLVTRCPGDEPAPAVTHAQASGGRRAHIDRTGLGAAPWQLDPPEEQALLARIRERGVRLEDFTGVRPRYGIKTGYNRAFLVDQETRDRLVAADPRSAERLVRCVRGQDIGRWRAGWGGQWLIFFRRGVAIDDYPALRAHLEPHRARLEPGSGRKAGAHAWYEVQDPVEYWELFEQPKILYQEIQTHPRYALDREGLYGNNKTFALPTDDLWVLGVLNSPLVWWFHWRTLTHMIGDTLSPAAFKLRELPIAEPAPALRREACERVAELVEGPEEGRARVLELEIARCVEEAYGLSEEELRLIWESAPPRMPAGAPAT